MKLSLVVLALALAGCGDDGSGAPADAPRDDGGTPDSPVDAGGEAVTVTAVFGGAPVPGAAIYFHQADGTLIAKEVTDATGTASHVVAAGTSVTAVTPFYNLEDEGDADIHTWVGVKPGDRLKLVDVGQTRQAVEMTIPYRAGATVYEMHATGDDPNFSNELGSVGPNGTNNVQGSLNVYDGPAKADVLIIADNADGNDYFYAPDQTLTGNPLDLTAGVYAVTPHVTWTLQNFPDDASDYSATSFLMTQKGSLYSVAYGGQLTNHSVTKTLTRPSIAGTKSIMRVDVTSATNVANQSFLVDWGAASATETYDMAGRRLTELTAAPSFDADNLAVKWTESATGVVADSSYAQLFVSRSGAPFAWRWEIAAPHGATGISLPVLPAEVTQYNATTTDTVRFGSVFWVKSPGGYDALRSSVLDGSVLNAAASSASGQAAYQVWLPSLARHRKTNARR